MKMMVSVNMITHLRDDPLDKIDRLLPPNCLSQSASLASVTKSMFTSLNKVYALNFVRSAGFHYGL